MRSAGFEKNTLKKLEGKMTRNIRANIWRSYFFPRPLLVSGSPFLPPLSKRASLLKIRSPRPPAETPKIWDFFFRFFFYFFGFHYKNIVSWKFKHLGNPILGTQTFFHQNRTQKKNFSALRAESNFRYTNFFSLESNAKNFSPRFARKAEKG